MSKRFYETANLSATEIQLSERNKHYIANVLRMKVGSTINIFNTEHGEFSAILTQVSKKAVTATIGGAIIRNTESALHTHLGIVISKGDRFDYAIQKSTELGVTQITPLFSERCDVKLKGERLEKRQQHWQEVAISASEQCLRIKPPTVHSAQTVDEWLRSRDEATRWVLHTSDGITSKKAIISPIALLIGPEGGLNSVEICAATSQGFDCIQLGQRILRTETAPVVALSTLHSLAGDFI